MAPSLRQKTKEKTEASAKTAKDAGFVNRPRKPPSHRQMYKHNKGLVDLKTSTEMQNISNMNATNSPLLRLPPEIRNEIFRISLTAQHRDISLYYNRRGEVSRSLTSTHPAPDLFEDIAIMLPCVCRQVYLETATLVYSENIFSFPRVPALKKWLSRRILAQREAICYLFVPRSAYYWADPPGPIIPMSPDVRVEDNRLHVEAAIRRLCPNLIAMEQDEFLDDNTSEAEQWIIHSRLMDPSSGDDLSGLVSD